MSWFVNQHIQQKTSLCVAIATKCHYLCLNKPNILLADLKYKFGSRTLPRLVFFFFYSNNISCDFWFNSCLKKNLGCNWEHENYFSTLHNETERESSLKTRAHFDKNYFVIIGFKSYPNRKLFLSSPNFKISSKMLHFIMTLKLDRISYQQFLEIICF